MSTQGKRVLLRLWNHANHARMGIKATDWFDYWVLWADTPSFRGLLD